MKGLRKLLGFALAFVALFAMTITPTYAAPAVPPQGTEVIIHKIVGTGDFELKDHNGGVLTPLQIATLWPGAVENNTGVKFTVWEVEPGTQVTDFSSTMTDQDVTDSGKTIGNPVVVNAGPIGPDGSGTFFKAGTYYVRETERPATLEKQYGVPFIMELPVLNADDNAYLTKLHLYPKNTIEDDMPDIDKDVETKDQNSAGFDVGYSFDYLIYPKVPAGIESYTVFSVSDTLKSTLDYMGSIGITYKGKDGTVNLEPNVDYTVINESSIGTAGGSFTVTFTQAGLKKLADKRPASETETPKDLEIKFKARINSSADMGTEIYNNAILTFNNGYFAEDQTRGVPTGNQPKVHTGGRKFIKVDNVTKTYLPELSTATFIVKNDEGKYMKKENGIVTWGTDEAATRIQLVDGAFEVTGLAYGDNGESVTYWLEEVVVPTDYIVFDEDLDFTIDANSYRDGTPVMEVINVKRPHIPQTGGIGTIIFLAIGITMMGAAVVALRRKEQSKK